MITLIIKGLLIGTSGTLYRMGGSDGYSKLYRRLGVPLAVFINSLFIAKIDINLCIVAFVMLFGSLSLGYGVNSHLTKWLKNPYAVRGTVGLLCSLSALPLMWGNWMLFGFYTIMLVSWWTLNGNQRFKFNDEIEEFGMGLMIASLPILL
jgi:hypothetical protein